VKPYQSSITTKFIWFILFFLFATTTNMQAKKIIDVDDNCYTRILCLEKKIADTLDEVRWSIGEIILDADTTITTSGLYVLGKDVETIEIDADDVVLDLNNYEVASDETAITVLSGQKNVVIKNGSVRGSCENKGETGILISEGAEFVQIRDMNIYGFEKGIYFEGTDSNNIRSCDVRNTNLHCDTKGIVLEYTIKSTFEYDEAFNCIQAGYELANSKFNYFYKCNALETKNDDPEEHAIGFSATSGEGNIFIECISNGSEKTDSDFCYKATGFSFKGTSTQAGETKSEIYNCIASKSTGAGLGNGYGIHLDMVLRNTAQYDVLSSPTASINWGTMNGNSVDWSGESLFVAVGYEAGDIGGDDNALRIYKYSDNTTLTLFAAANADTTDILSVAFSPNAKYIAAGTTGNDLYVYPFDPTQATATILTAAANEDVGDSVNSIDWHPNSRYIVIGLDDGATNEVQIWEFDDTNLVSPAFATDSPATEVRSVAFSPDGKYIAAVYGSTLEIYSFSYLAATNATRLTPVQTFAGVDQLYTVDWCPIACNGLYYLAIGGDDDGTDNIETVSFDGTTIASIVKDQAIAGEDIRSLQWSPNGKYLLVCGTGTTDQIEILQFDATAETVTSKDTGDFSGESTANSCVWSLSGLYVAVAGNNTGTLDTLDLFEVGNGPTNCAIKNNEVINCTGGLAGIGLEGSSGNNMIIRNIGYENHINFSDGVFNQFMGGLNGNPTNIENISVPPYED